MTQAIEGKGENRQQMAVFSHAERMQTLFVYNPL